MTICSWLLSVLLNFIFRLSSGFLFSAMLLLPITFLNIQMILSVGTDLIKPSSVLIHSTLNSTEKFGSCLLFVTGWLHSNVEGIDFRESGTRTDSCNVVVLVLSWMIEQKPSQGQQDCRWISSFFLLSYSFLKMSNMAWCSVTDCFQGIVNLEAMLQLFVYEPNLL